MCVLFLCSLLRMVDAPCLHEYDALRGDAAASNFLRFRAESDAGNWDAACLGPLCHDGVVGGAMN